MLPQKYIIAVIGYADDGKTTTISKAFQKIDAKGVISHIRRIWGTPANNPIEDFSLTGNTKYGLTGILSQGDAIKKLYAELDRLVKIDCNVIICACRKQYPDTFNAVAKISWEHDYSIIWIKFDRPHGVTQDNYTDSLADKIFNLFA